MKVVGALLLIAVLANFFADIYGDEQQCDFNSDCAGVCKRHCSVDTKPLCYTHTCYCSPASLYSMVGPSQHRPVPMPYYA